MGKPQLVILILVIILVIGYFMFNKSNPELAGNNKQTGEAFLATNTDKEGVITTASGLQYIILTEGAGEKPIASSSVTVHYQGTTLDGKEFDSSYSRNAPCHLSIKSRYRRLDRGRTTNAYRRQIPIFYSS